MRGISWIDIQWMLADMPFHDYSKEKEDDIIEVNTLEQHNAIMKLKERRK